MIRHPDPDLKGFVPGSGVPKYTSVVFNETVEGYLDDKLWQSGISLTLVGPPGCGKTTLGLSVLHRARERDEHRQAYWAESDYLADLRQLWRLEDMVGKLPRDDALWFEYVEWEQRMWDRKDRLHMFLDETCRSYTTMQQYEVENLLRYREAKGLATMIAASTKRWEDAPDEVTSLMERQNYLITLEARGDGRG